MAPQDAIRDAYPFAAEEMNSGRSNEEIERILVKRGLDAESAALLVLEIRAARREAAQKDVLYGGLWCAGGIVVSVVSYSSASGGGSYIVAWGAVVFGAIRFFRGLARSSSG